MPDKLILVAKESKYWFYKFYLIFETGFTVNEMHESHEVVLIDVGQEQERLVSICQQTGQERAARRQNCSV